MIPFFKMDNLSKKEIYNLKNFIKLVTKAKDTDLGAWLDKCLILSGYFSKELHRIFVIEKWDAVIFLGLKKIIKYRGTGLSSRFLTEEIGVFTKGEICILDYETFEGHAISFNMDKKRHPGLRGTPLDILIPYDPYLGQKESEMEYERTKGKSWIDILGEGLERQEKSKIIVSNTNYVRTELSEDLSKIGLKLEKTGTDTLLKKTTGAINLDDENLVPIFKKWEEIIGSDILPTGQKISLISIIRDKVDWKGLTGKSKWEKIKEILISIAKFVLSKSTGGVTNELFYLFGRPLINDILTKIDFPIDKWYKNFTLDTFKHELEIIISKT